MSAHEQELRAGFVAGLAGRTNAYRDCLMQLSRHVRAYLRRRLSRTPDDVEDLVQETLLAIHNQRHTYDPSQPLTPWVHAIARYKLVDFLRRRSLRDALHDSLDEVAELADASEIEAADARRDLGRLLERLPPTQRTLVLRLKVEGVSLSEVAIAAGMSETAVKVSVHRALKKLAAFIRESDEDR